MAQETNSPSTETLGVTSRESVTLPESVDGDDAVALWNSGFGDDVSAEQEETNAGPVDPPEGVEEGADIIRESGEGEPDGEEQEGQEEQEKEVALPELADAPEFWGEEDRKEWLTAPPKLREIVKRMEKQRIDAVNEKTREASEKVRTAQDGAKQLLDLVQNSAQWWQQNGAALQEGMRGKWAHINFDELVESNPAEFQRLKHLKEKDDAVLAEARTRGERDMQITTQRQQAELVDRKRASHEVMAREMPEHFGPGKYESTYTRLGEFLQKQGIPADRINNIHEAPIIRMAMESMLYRESKAKASGVVSQRDVKTGQYTAKTAPTRVQPGPGQVPGNRQAELARQAMKQLKDSRGTDDSAALRVFRNLS